MCGEGDQGSVVFQFRGLIERAAQALGVESGAGIAPAPSRFDSDCGQTCGSFSVPLLPDVEALIQAGFTRPTDPFKTSVSCRRMSAMSDREKVGCGALPQVDQSIAALVFPSSSVLGKATCPSRGYRMVDALLAKVHRTISVQAQLANTMSILTLYNRHLTRELEVGRVSEQLAAELQLVSSVMAQLMKEQVSVAGRSIASLWVTRRQLWLSQSSLQSEDQNGLLKLPVVPQAMFGPAATAMLQQAHEARQCARDVSGGLARRRKWQRTISASRPPPQPSQQQNWRSGDLRATIEAQRYRNRGKGKQGFKAQTKGRPKAPPQS